MPRLGFLQRFLGLQQNAKQSIELPTDDGSCRPAWSVKYELRSRSKSSLLVNTLVRVIRILVVVSALFQIGITESLNLFNELILRKHFTATCFDDTLNKNDSHSYLLCLS